MPFLVNPAILLLLILLHAWPDGTVASQNGTSSSANNSTAALANATTGGKVTTNAELDIPTFHFLIMHNATVWVIHGKLRDCSSRCDYMYLEVAH